MRVNLTQTLDPAPRPRPRDAYVDLPADLAFLRAYGVPHHDLRRAARRASVQAVPAAEALIAAGGISAHLFYRALADHLGLPFVQSGIALAPGPAASATAHGLARLAPGAQAPWLLAPRGAALSLLLEARRRGLRMPDALVTTPSRLSLMARGADEVAMTHAASEGLPERDPGLSAKTATDRSVKLGLAVGLVVLGTAAALAPLPTAIAAGLVFFAAMTFRLMVCAAGLAVPHAVAEAIADRELPLYSVLVPIYREAAMVPALVARLDALDYPRAKLEIRLLVEADDAETQLACLAAPLAPHYEVIVVPSGHPRTKPRALNLALPLVRGTLVTIFDAEDAPEPQQLRQAAARFHHAPPDLACLQASLAIHNGAESLLARLFSLEYAGLFDLFNKGIAAWHLPMALGGTSNHFRAAALRAVGGWDAWNVAEDADLGLRLARFGFRTEVLAATTSEEAPTDLGNWFRQRRRWTKGWMQTALVLGRHPGRLYAELGLWQTVTIFLQLTSLVAGPLAACPLTVITAVWFCAYDLPECAAWAQWAEATLWGSVFALGPASVLWPAYAAARMRRLQATPLAVLALLPYQVLIGLAAWGGLVDLLVRPHHWHKTRHGAAITIDRAHTSDENRRAGAPAWLAQPLVRAFRAAYRASRAAFRSTSSAMTRDARARAAAASAALASSAA